MDEEPTNIEVDKKKQKEIIEKYSNEWDELKEGDLVYLIDATWYNRWLNYVTDETGEGFEKPEEIDNTDLIIQVDKSVETSGYILIDPDLEEKKDYIVLTKNAWETLRKWYQGGPEIERKIIVEGINNEKRAEIHLLHIKVYRLTEQGKKNKETEIIVHESKKSKLKRVLELIKKKYKIPPEEKVRIWNYIADKLEPMWKELDKSLDDLQIIPGQSVYIERRLKNRHWAIKHHKFKEFKIHKIKETIVDGWAVVTHFFNPVERIATSITTPPISGSKSNRSIPGVCGLLNLGNTCFMNSALQCLSNTEALSKYFVDDLFKNHINRDNPLGMKGNLAEQYAITIKHIWSGDYSYIAPRNLKSVLGRFAPRFSGYSQQDSQEFLAFLLDGLHEDLNRILKKPYIELKDSNGRPDSEVAVEAWDAHKKRNESIIVDLFQAQLKSTLICPVCNHISITFDPFMYLSLPLPSKIFKEIIIYDKNNLTAPIKFGASVNPTTLVREFIENIMQQIVEYKKQQKIKKAKELGKEEYEIEELEDEKEENCRYMITSVYNKRIQASIDINAQVTQVATSSKNIFGALESWFIYKIPKCFYDAKLFNCCQFFHKKMKPIKDETIGWPFIINLPIDCTAIQLYYYVLLQLRRVIQIGYFEKFQLTHLLLPSHVTQSKTSVNNNNKIPNPEAGVVNSIPGKFNEECPSPPSLNDLSVWEYVSNPSNFQSCSTFPFDIKYSIGSNSICGICKNKKCSGCKIAFNSEPIIFTSELNTNNRIFAVEWTQTEYLSLDKLTTILLSPELEALKKSSATENPIYLRECLDLFRESEILGINDKWHCPKCKDFVQAKKQIELWSAPEILIIHLKRFTQSKGRSKIITPVIFPKHNLDLKDFLLHNNGKSTFYDLFAVSQHSGSLHGGHYTAVGMNKNGNWYNFNDQSVSPCNSPADSISSSTAYLLFYKRNDSLSSPLVSDTQISESSVPTPSEQDSNSENLPGSDPDSKEDIREY